MISINLLPGPQKRRGRRAGLSLPAMGDLLGKIEEPLLIGVVSAWLVVAVVVGVLYFTQSAALADLREQKRVVQNEMRRYNTLIAQQRRATESRDSLLAELEALMKQASPAA